MDDSSPGQQPWLELCANVGSFLGVTEGIHAEHSEKDVTAVVLSYQAHEGCIINTGFNK